MPAPGKNIIAGNRLPVRQALSIDRSLTEAQQVRVTYKGEADETLQAYDEYSRGAVRSSYRQTGSTAEIEVQYAAVPGEVGTGDGTVISEVLSEEIRYTNNQVQVRLWDSPYFSDLGDGDVTGCLNTLDQIREVRAVVREGADGTAAAHAAANERSEILANFLSLYTNEPVTTVVTRAMAHLMGDFQPPIAFFPVITYRRVVAAASTFQLDGGRTGAIFSTNALPVPSDLLGRISTPAVANTLALRQFHVYAWLGQVDMSTLSDGSVELVETYTYGAYPIAYYDGTHD